MRDGTRGESFPPAGHGSPRVNIFSWLRAVARLYAQHIRPARPEDAAAVASLASQLGYPATRAEIEPRLALILPDPTQLIAVAEISGQALGWIHAAFYPTLESGPVVEVRGLVVDEKHRGIGIGRALTVRAEEWARERGTRVVRLRSNIIRNSAHAFYQRLGYSIVKTQHSFHKTLD